jgi:hypothetical protein
VEDGEIYPEIAFWDFSTVEPTLADLPRWADALVGVFERHQPRIDSRRVQQSSDATLAVLAEELLSLGYEVEHRPARLPFNVNGVRFNVDAWHPTEGVVLEIEAVRAQLGGAFFRDIFRLMLIGRQRHGVIAVPLRGTQGGRTTRAFDYCRKQLDALSSTRPQLPFNGLLLVGY